MSAVTLAPDTIIPYLYATTCSQTLAMDIHDYTDLVELDKHSQLHPFTNLSDHQQTGPLVMMRGQGTRLTDHTGKEYLDALAGLWCMNVGYGRTEIAQAVAEQIEQLSYFHSFLAMANQPSIVLADRLLQIAPEPLSRVFFGLSGSDANDTNIKIIWLYNNLLGRPQKKKLIARRGGYHGTTLATCSLSGLPHLYTGFDVPLDIDRFLLVTTPNHYRYAQPGMTELEFSAYLAEELEQLILRQGPETVAAFFAEPVMGASGVLVPPEGYFEAIVPVLRKYEVLFIADEVICGFGRLGSWFGSTHFDLAPDMMTLAKGLTSGYQPMSASLVSQEIWQVLQRAPTPFSHGFTYSSHPASAAAALANLDILESENLIERAQTVGAQLQRRLREEFTDHPLVGEVRGLGMVAGIELVANKSTKESFDPTVAAQVQVYKQMLRRGVVVRPVPNALAISPSLIFTLQEIETLVGALKESLDDVARQLASQGLLS
ncbi:MAG: aminotransferase class III-fold pyridoxal phosphate-dependent enzyme [Pirellulaceae bacterium]|nr:aminotransferase class III-fold pyridoxal phosphate-dependent enzyme [Pirellulaceae bacterium]